MAKKLLKSLKLHGLDEAYDIPSEPEDVGAAPAYSQGTEDLIAGETELETGKLYFVYE